MLTTGLFNYLDNQWLPTWLHFAAVYGLKELLQTLLKFPASAKAFFVRNGSGRKPIDLAIEQGHLDVVRILNDYGKQIERLQEELVASTNGLSLFDNEHMTLPSSIQSGQCVLKYNAPKNGKDFAVKRVGEGWSARQSELQSRAFVFSVASENRILQAKNELLLLIEKFKCGISIDNFKEIFTDWERLYNDVLEGQMSNELQFSLNQIKMLCSLDDIHQSDYDDDDEGAEVEEEEEKHKDVTSNGGYQPGGRRIAPDSCLSRQAPGQFNGRLRNEATAGSTIVATQADTDSAERQLNAPIFAPLAAEQPRKTSHHRKVITLFFCLFTANACLKGNDSYVVPIIDILQTPDYVRMTKVISFFTECSLLGRD